MGVLYAVVTQGVMTVVCVGEQLLQINDIHSNKTMTMIMKPIVLVMSLALPGQQWDLTEGSAESVALAIILCKHYQATFLHDFL